MLGFLKSKFRKDGLRAMLVRLHRGEQGAEGVEKLLLILVIVLPLLGVLIFFRDSISEWVTSKWNDIAGRTGEPTLDMDVPEL